MLSSMLWGTIIQPLNIIIKRVRSVTKDMRLFQTIHLNFGFALKIALEQDIIVLM